MRANVWVLMLVLLAPMLVGCEALPRRPDQAIEQPRTKAQLCRLDRAYCQTILLVDGAGTP